MHSNAPPVTANPSFDVAIALTVGLGPACSARLRAKHVLFATFAPVDAPIPGDLEPRDDAQFAAMRRLRETASNRRPSADDWRRFADGAGIASLSFDSPKVVAHPQHAMAARAFAGLSGSDPAKITKQLLASYLPGNWTQHCDVTQLDRNARDDVEDMLAAHPTVDFALLSAAADYAPTLYD